jgi:predicted ATPase
LEKTRLLESLTRLVDRMSRGRPLLLLIDDLQWADRETLRFVSYVGRDLESFRVLLVGVFSVEYLEEAPAVGETVGMLRRAGGLAELRLDPLGLDEVGELAGALLGGELTAQALEMVAGQTGGNPLFVAGLLEELAGAGLLFNSEGRWGVTGALHDVVPTVAEDVIAARLGRLAPEERRLVEAVAVNGAEVEHGLVRSVSELSEEDFVSVAAGLVSRGLIVEHPQSGSIAFVCAHPLVARVAYRHLPGPARRRVHASYIEVMEAEGGGDGERLAWHYERAGVEVDQERRLEVLLKAGKRALDRYANEEAATSLQTALEVARRLGRDDVIPDILEDRGEARSRLGEERAAIEVWEEALALHRRTQVGAPLARLHRRLALAESNLGRFDASERRVTAGLEALGEGSDDGRIELEAVRGPFGFRIERDLYFPGGSLAELISSKRLVISGLGAKGGAK